MAHEDPFSKNTNIVPLSYTDDKTLDILRIHPFFSASHFFFLSCGIFSEKIQVVPNHCIVKQTRSVKVGNKMTGKGMFEKN